MSERNIYGFVFCGLLSLFFSCTSLTHKSIVISTKDSITAAIQKLSPGDTLFLRGGIYREAVKILNSGEEDLPLVIKAFPGEKVVLTGTEEIKKWEKVRENYYKAFCPKEVLQLFNNNKMLMPARWPNIDSAFDKKGWVPMLTGKDSAMFIGYSWPKNYWNGALCFASTGKRWVVTVETINGNKDGNLKMKEKWFDYQSGSYTGEGKGYIIKHLNALDTINEWHWQNDTLYAMLTEEPVALEAQTKEVLFEGVTISDVVLKNISVFGGRIQMRNCESILLDNVDVTYGTALKSYEFPHGATHAAVKFYGESENCTIQNSVVDKNWGSGVYLEGDNNVVFNCIVSNSNWTGTGAAAIATCGENHVVMNCSLFNAGKFLVSHGNTKNILVKYNNIYNGGFLARDLGLTYTYATYGEGSEIAYNWVHDNRAEESGAGIYIDIASHDFLIHHNVVWNCAYGLQTIMNAFDHQIYNNTVWDCGKAINYWGEIGSNMYNQRVYNNLANDIFDAGTDVQFNMCTGVNQFVDLKKHDFRLAKKCAAIDYGTFIPGITNYYTGKSPDAGAYEFGMEAWVPGYDSTCVYAD
ncbi:MAG: right-handed parallel beta-helix repeat-containing protein [Bacteroidetes bacterium]|nr:right-handed parallel beta-helix repeat-containing protein [Bacteroidota bacterium]